MNPALEGDRPSETVPSDWRRHLSTERQNWFDARTRNWERDYAMLSITLDSALTERSRGELVHARQQVGCASDLAQRLSGSLLPTLSALARSRQWRREPAVEPLQPGDFRGESAQEAAAWNALLHWPLLFQNWRFALKLRALRRAVQDVTAEFCAVAGEIAEGACVEPTIAWRALEALHDDLNTALREAFVVLKSFLCAISAEGYRFFLAAVGEIKVNAFPPEQGMSPASP